MSLTIDISPDLSFPLDAATETFGILAKKGAGKSNAAVVMAEEMWDAGIPWVAIDPKGDWWGLRSSGDGDAPGLPLPVFGGRHGDIPLEPSAGVMLADLILSQRLTCVLDVSEFTKAEVSRFLIAFADRLYRQAENEPLHLFLEEAHEYLPQRVMRDEAKLVGAWQKIVKQGRFKGLGCTLVSQRSASLNKDVLTQVDTLIVLRTTSPQDRAAVKAWVDVHAESGPMLDTLPSLEDGEAWVWSPEFLHDLVRIKFRRRRTFDSGATPKVGEARRAPATLADVDLEMLRVQMADTIEKAKASDPKVLQARIRELEKQSREAKPQTVTVVERVEVPVEVSVVPEGLGELLGQAVQVLEQAKGLLNGSAPTRKPLPPVSKPTARRLVPPVEVEADAHLRAGARRMLEVLARHRDFKVTRSQLGTLSRFSPRGGTFGTYLGDLKRAGLIVEEGGLLRATDAGLAFFGELPSPPTSTEELMEQWGQVLRKGEREMLDLLVGVYPEGVDRETLAEQTGFTASGGTFGTYLGVLRRNGLIEVEGGLVTASQALFI